ncbi:TIGR03885 family FMN-dependent LLM class oxidoreductase [Pyxidicoccus xibeiensis]|uniref:TIGR03885 family FMN-dependent LLM class oxidoreductase n=1 Tax=Pyxidicoccus xibeiensis TaxID=2906759 RepID=UPI0020A76331|nr:TIGR03885 family FMN-dependent LLM class oxidoreductase [Pyxidicoccus xibeiensis]MCP3140722.1 TIGR03885 family FMN-dependent LLM class oxidoreductase [Pyxidicoccus xibeiensis]
MRGRMLTLGYHASHEQFPPSELLRLAQKADAAGFTAALNSDHFHPWNEAQGHSGFAWSWMGAALATTKLTSVGVVNAPGQRYHPAIIAQALGTLAEMFPGRAWAALGSGQLVNEGITGDTWPPKDLRNARLRECVDVMRALFRGETVTHRGLVRVEEAKLYSRPATPPMLVGAAITPQTAEWVGSWADALITVSKPPEELRKMVDAFRRGGGEGKPMFLKVQLSWAPEEAVALQGAMEQWGTNIFASSVLTDLRRPAQFEEMARTVQPKDLEGHVRVSSSLQRHVDWLAEDVRLGFSRLYLHNVNRGQDAFIEAFAQHVLPALRSV